MKGWMYILACADGSYYAGSTNNLELRLAQHQAGEGANHTKKRLPVKLVYFEEFQRVDGAFYREKQLQGWSRKKKEALINGMPANLKKLAECMNETHYRNYNKGGFDYAQPPGESAQPPVVDAQPPGDSNSGFDYAQPPDRTTQPPDKTAQPPGDGNSGFDYAQPPDRTTQPPDKTAQPPVDGNSGFDYAQPPDRTTQPPDKTAQPPVDATRCLSVVEGRTITNSISEVI